MNTLIYVCAVSALMSIGLYVYKSTDVLIASLFDLLLQHDFTWATRLTLVLYYTMLYTVYL